MRTTLAVIAVAAAALIVLGASTRVQAKEKQESTYSGCLAKGDTDGTFKLTNVGDAKAEYDLVGGGGDLGAHVGHKVDIKGHPLSAEQVEKKLGGKAESGHTYLRVKSMSHVAASCP
jgi:hypothetical protein